MLKYVKNNTRYKMRSGPWTKFLAILTPPHTKTLLLNMYVAVMVFDQPPSPAQHLYMWWFEHGLLQCKSQEYCACLFLPFV